MKYDIQGKTILFQGDSITDGGRNREDLNSLGNGYVMMIQAQYYAEFFNHDTIFLNKGISGNKAIDLYNRWDEDCISLNPDLLTIFVGINDTSGNNSNEDIDFHNYYTKILEKTINATNAKIILMEPFVFPINEATREKRRKLYKKIEIVRELAYKYKTSLIPLDGILNSVAIEKGYEFWSMDGVHPTMEGHALIAKEWFKELNKIVKDK